MEAIKDCSDTGSNKTFISFSGGIESTTMCVLYGKGAKAIFADTGSEHEEMYKRLSVVAGKLKELHKGDFSLIKVKANVNINGKKVDNLTDYILESKFFPSFRKRFCTRIFKIQAIDKFLSDKGKVKLLIGLNADEERLGNLALGQNVLYSYPLKEHGITRLDCIDILDKLNLTPNFPAYMQRGGCIFCPFKSRKEFKAMVHLAKHELDIVRKIEETIQDQRDIYFRIRENMPRLAEFIRNEEQNLFGNLSDHYFTDEGSKSCGPFCHR